jgi:DNA-binding CsgD family transcriptional regulator
VNPVLGLQDHTRNEGIRSDPTLDHVRAHASLLELQRALDVDGLWRATRNLLDNVLRLHSCSLMLGINDFEPSLARHHVVEAPHPDYQPATSLQVSQRYLYSHPQIKLYTYSQIVSEDPSASQRRLEQEPFLGAWAEFVHLAFWHGERLEGVLSIRRGEGNPFFSNYELNFLEGVYPMIDAALHRLRVFDSERAKRMPLERFLHTSPFPVMFVDADGALLFATAEARRCYERWTDGASHRCRDTGLKLPSDICALLERARVRAMHGPEHLPPSRGDDLTLRHPSIAGLSVRADVSWPVSGAPARPSYVLTFTLSKGADGEKSELSANALLTLQRLSPTERRVALLVLEGLRNDEISQRLCRSRRTIEFQLNSIYRKLDVSSRTHLVRLLA